MAEMIQMTLIVVKLQEHFVDNFSFSVIAKVVSDKCLKFDRISRS